jgi:hypothetical protein
MVPAGDSLTVRLRAGQPGSQPEAPLWPDPCPMSAWEKVCDVVGATPGLSAASIQKISKVRREHVQIALIKSEQAGIFTNTGSKSSPKWVFGGGFVDWISEIDAKTRSTGSSGSPVPRFPGSHRFPSGSRPLVVLTHRGRGLRFPGTGNRERQDLRPSFLRILAACDRIGSG